MDRRTGTATDLAILAAVGSCAATIAGHPPWGFVAALLSLPLGSVGLVMTATPRLRAGGESVLAITLGGLGLLVAVLGLAGVF